MAEARTERLGVLGDGSRWLLALAVLGWGFVSFYLFHWGASWALDLRVYRAAGHSLFHGGRPYSSLFTANRLPFTYPPFALLVLGPLSFGPLGLIKALWWAVNESALILVLYLVIRRCLGIEARRALLLATAGGAVATLALEPLRSNLDYGQINLLLMLFVVVDALVIRGRGRGALIGIAAAIKLTPLLYLAYLFIDRDRRAAYRGAAVFAGLTGLSWLILPSESARYWLHEAFSPSRTGPVGSVSNQSWNGLVHREPFHAGTLGVAFWIVLSIVTVGVGVLAARGLLARGRTVDGLLALALSELLVSPISWSHHWSWVVLVPVVLVARCRDRAAVTVGLGALLVITIAEPYWWSVHGWPGAVLADTLVLVGALGLGALAWEARTVTSLPGPSGGS